MQKVKYSYWEGTKGLVCFYCGNFAGEKDHIPPVSRVDDYILEVPKSRQRFFIVPCCRECNRILGDKLQTTVLGRVRCLKGKLKSKYYRQLKVTWTQEELDGLEGRLYDYVKSSLEHPTKKQKQAQAKRLRIMSRIEYMDSFNEFQLETMFYGM